MRKILAILLFFTFAFASELKIATYNVENLFDAKVQGSEYNDFKNGNWNAEKYSFKLEKTVDVLKRLDADIVALQEIENFEVLKDLAQKSGYKFYKFSKSDKNSPFGVAVLSRIKIKDTIFYPPPLNIKSRDILRCDFTFEGKNFSIFVNHFLAKKNAYNKRIANATQLSSVLRNVKNVVVLGDFNTNYGPDSLLNDIINRYNLVDLWKFLPSIERISHQSGRAIDHILLSQDFFKNGALNYKDESFGVFNKNFKNSDHLPIFFTLSSKPNMTPIIDEKIATVDEIYGINAIKNPIILKNAVVVYKDKNGFVITQNRRGIYVFDRHNFLNLGDRVDLKIQDVGFYKGNFEITDYQVLQKISKEKNLSENMLEFNEISQARSGDVINKIVADIKDGKIQTKYGKFPFFSPNKKIENGKNLTFKNVLVKTYKGKKELILN